MTEMKRPGRVSDEVVQLLLKRDDLQPYDSGLFPAIAAVRALRRLARRAAANHHHSKSKGDILMTSQEKTDLSRAWEEVMHKKMNSEELTILEEAALHIDPSSAEVEWIYAEQVIGSYREVWREYFARSPRSDIWVWFGDLPTATLKSLWEKHRPKLTYPAGLFLPLRDVPRSPECENFVELEHSTFNLYGNSREELVICGDDLNLACVPLERASLLIEQMRAFLEILKADALDAGARA